MKRTTVCHRWERAGLSLFFATLLVSVLAGSLLLLLPASPAAAEAPIEGPALPQGDDLPGDLLVTLGRTLAADAPADYQPRAAADGYRLANPAHNLSADFAATGLRLTLGGESWGLTLTGLGRGDAIAPLSAAEPTAHGSELRYSRGLLTEWYLNSAWGLEQGFTLHTPPAGNPAEGLTLVMALNGSLRAVLQDDATLRLTNAAGATLGRYTGLTAFDANGVPLAARLSLSGDARELAIHVADAGAAYPITIDPWIQAAKLTASDGGANYVFGTSVAIDGDTAVVGAPGFGVGTEGVYVFVKSGPSWLTATQTAKLTADNVSDSQAFAKSVAISGDTIVASYDKFNSYQGVVYVFEKPGGGWITATQTAQLTASNGGANHSFGYSLDIDGDTIVVGATGVSSVVNGANYAGAVYVFEKPGANWTDSTESEILVQRDTPLANDYLGRGVAISGDVIVASAPNALDTADRRAFVWQKPGASWDTGGSYLTADATLLLAGTGTTIGDRYALDIDGDTIVFGDKTTSSEAVYVFEKPGGGWSGDISHAAQLTTDGDVPGGEFGGAVAIAGNIIAVSSPSDSAGGTVFVFNKPAGGWITATTHTAEVYPSDLAGGDQFGASVDISGSTLLVGAKSATIGGNSQQGAAYIFEGSFNPDLVISKSVTPASAQPGQTITYTLAFTNAGAGSATGVRITDTVPLSVTGNSVISSGAVITPVNGARYAWQIGDLAPSDSGVITISGVLSNPLAAGVFTNSAVITTTVIDTDPDNNSAAVGLTVSNAAPVAADDSTSTAEDTPVSGTLSATDANSDVLTYTIAVQSLHGMAIITDANGGDYQFTPALDFNGVTTFTFAASDGDLSDTGVVTVTVNPVNDAPEARVEVAWKFLGEPGFSVTRAYGPNIAVFTPGQPCVGYEEYDGGYLANVMCFDGATWQDLGTRGSLFSRGQFVELAFDDNGTLYALYKDTSYLKVSRYNGSSWEDVGNNILISPDSNNEHKSLVIDHAGNPYVGFLDSTAKVNVVSYTVAGGWQSVGTADLSAGTATHPRLAIDSQNIPYVAYKDNANSGYGTVMRYTGGTWQPVGSAGFTGVDATDITIGIDANDIPYVVHQDYDSSAAANAWRYSEGSWERVGSPNFRNGANDMDNLVFDSLNRPYFTYANPGKQTTVRFNGSEWETVGSASVPDDRTSAYPSLAIDREDNLYFSVFDYAESFKATVMAYQQGAITQTTVTMSEDSSPTPFALTLVGGDVDGDVITWTLKSQPVHGPAVMTVTGALTAAFAYTPTANYTGTDTFDVTLTDGALTETVTVDIVVNNVNDAPVAADSSVSARDNVPYHGSLSATDIDSAVLTYTVQTAPISGTVLITDVNSGDYVYTPTLGYAGNVTFTFAASDGDLSDTGQVTLTLITNNPPVADDDSASTAEDTTVSGTLSATDTDHAVLTYTIAVQSLNGMAVITNANSGGYIFTPTLNFNGVTTFTFAVSDSQDIGTGVVTVTVTPVDDAPVASDSSETTLEDIAFSGVFSATEPDGDVLTYTLLAAPNPLTATVAITDMNSGGYIFTPTLNVNGVVSFTFVVSDGSSSESGAVTVIVTAVNDPPEFTAGGDVTVQENAGYNAAWATDIRPGPASASDESGQVVTFSLTTDNPGLFAAGPSLSASGTLSFTPSANTVGSAVVTATLQDDGGGNDTSGSAVFNINIWSAADLSLSQTVTPAKFSPGQALTYTLTYTNLGPNLARGVVITDLIPAVLESVSIDAGGAAITATGSVSYVWQVANLAANESRVITISGIVSPGMTTGLTELVNEAHIAGDALDVNAGNNSASVTTPANLLVTINNGLGDTGTYLTLQAAVDAAGPASTLKLAGDVTGINTTGGGSQLLYLDKNLTIAGGYTPGNWTTPNPDAYPTTLNPGGHGRAVVVTGTATVATLRDVIVTGGDAGGNGGGPGGSDAGGGIYVAANSAGVILNNVTVVSNTADYGGGIYAVTAVSATGCRVAGNSATVAGGGVYALTNPVLNGCEVEGNQSGGDGGGVYVDNNFSLNVSAVISGNQAGGNGGGVYASGDATVSAGRFESNTSSSGSGGGLYASGGLNLSGTPVFSGNTASSNGGGAFVGSGGVTAGGLFENNRSSGGSGGGLYVASTLSISGTRLISNTAQAGNGGGLAVNNTIWMTNTQVLSNSAALGGGVYGAADATLTGSILQGNRSGGSGGGVNVNGRLQLVDTALAGNQSGAQGGGAFAGGDITVTGCRLEQNGATAEGGGLYAPGALEISASTFIGNSANHGGGVYHTGSANARIENSLFARNSVGSSFPGGAAICLNSTGNADLIHLTIASPGGNPQEAIAAVQGNITVQNSIIAQHTIGVHDQGADALSGDYNLYFDDNLNVAEATCANTYLGGTHNQCGDPRFTDENEDDYTLQFGSVAIDTGADLGLTTDLAGNSRPQGDGIDIGAYESALSASNNVVFLPLIIKNQ